MPSVLVQYNGDKVETRGFKERLRGVGWTRNGSCVVVVGDRGTSLRFGVRNWFGLISTLSIICVIYRLTPVTVPFSSLETREQSCWVKMDPSQN